MKKAIVSFGMMVLLLGSGCVRSLQPIPAPQQPNSTSVIERQNPTVANPKPKCSTALATVDTSNWQVYRNAEQGFEICFPPDFVAVPKNQAILMNPIVEKQYPNRYYTGTNLHYAHTGVQVVSGACSMPNFWDTNVPVAINGTTFQVGSFIEGAAGNKGETLQYQTDHGNKCYQIPLALYYVNPDSYRDANGEILPGSPKDFDRKKVEEIFGQVVMTFKFI